jgi:hypothetical protein
VQKVNFDIFNFEDLGAIHSMSSMSVAAAAAIASTLLF